MALSDRLHAMEALRDVGQHRPKGDVTGTKLVFAEDAGSLRAILTAHRDQLARPEILWVAYPKASRAAVNRASLWPILGEYGLRPMGQVALAEVWSAMRFRPLKEGEAPVAGGR